MRQGHAEHARCNLLWLHSRDTLAHPSPQALALITPLLDDENVRNEAALAALNTFVAEVPKFAPDAYAMNFHPQNTVIFNAIRDRLTQVMTGELTLDEAIERIQTEADDAIAAAGA